MDWAIAFMVVGVVVATTLYTYRENRVARKASEMQMRQFYDRLIALEERHYHIIQKILEKRKD